MREGVVALRARVPALYGVLGTYHQSRGLSRPRLQTGTVTPLIREIDLDEGVPLALGGVPENTVVLDIPEDLPMVAADPGLLERSVANLVENAVKYSPDGEPVLVSASALGDRVEIRVVLAAPVSPTTPRTASSRPSSATATYRAAPTSASAWPSPAASPKPSAAA
ncbi:two-component histidine kinase KdpD [Streptomyces sp. NBRC 110611]|nr:two-component histidine kinase KdpD [Streptomyces sp. NBRC 110611]